MKKYLVNYSHITIETLKGAHAELAVKIHPDRCFDGFYTAKQALIRHCDAARDKANEDLQKVYRLNNKPISNDSN